MPLVLKAIGNVEAFSTVQVKSQVEGEVMRVHFREGQEVKKGDLLFTIDPRPFEALLQQAQANLARDKALLENARKDARRYESLIQQKLVSTGEYEQYATKAASLEATVKAAAAAVENARLKLEYTAIRSPIDGKTGDLLINQGNLVKANDEKAILVVIKQIVPIYVNFAFPEHNLPEIKKYMAQGKLRVEVAIPPAEQYRALGELAFVDNKVDQATGTIQLKAIFKNHDRTLWPGQFVNVGLILREQPDALVIPVQALQAGQQGNYVYVITPDQTADPRPVQLDRTANGLAVIKSGLKPGEQVVIDGQLRLFPGAKVEIKGALAGRRKSLVNLAEPFIRRPVMTTLVMLAILLAGVMGYRNLPVSELPNVDFPTIQVTASLPGASPETMASAVATPLEKQFATIAGIDSMTSTSALGSTRITVQFNLNRDIDAAALDIQAAISQTLGQLPKDMPSPPIFTKVNPADFPILYLTLSSPTLPLSTVDEYGQTYMAQRISMISGVAQVLVYGAQKYAVRVQVDPYALASRGIGIDEVQKAIAGG